MVGQDAARGVAKRTRPEKKLIDPEELRKRWKEEIGDIHHEPGDLTPATKLMVEQLLSVAAQYLKRATLTAPPPSSLFATAAPTICRRSSRRFVGNSA